MKTPHNEEWSTSHYGNVKRACPEERVVKCGLKSFEAACQYVSEDKEQSRHTTVQDKVGAKELYA